MYCVGSFSFLKMRDQDFAPGLVFHPFLDSMVKKEAHEVWK